MTTIHDTDPNTHTITSACTDLTESIDSDYETDANVQTVATAWASCPFGEAEDEVRYGFAAPEEPVGQPDAVDTRSVARHAITVAALACGIGAGAAIGLMFFDPSTTQPMVVGPGVVASPHHAEVIGPNGLAPSPKAAVPVQETAPAAVAPTTTVAPAIANQPSTAAVATPPVATPGETTVIVDIPIPDSPPLPKGPAPEDAEPPQDPDPDPPVLHIPNFNPPEVSKPQTDPDLPTLLPKPTRIANLNPQLEPHEPTLDSRFEPIGPKKKPTNKRMNPIGP